MDDLKIFQRKRFTFFIGVDVSKLTLDFVIMRNNMFLYHKQIKNTQDEISLILDEYKEITGFKISNSVFGIETIGLYSNHLISFLLKKKANIVNENALKIKNSLGNIRGKTDKIDAERIAHYLYKSRDILRLWKSRRPIIDQLSNLSSLRLRLVTLEKSIRNPLNESKGFESMSLVGQNLGLCSRSLTALKLDIKDIDHTIKEVWSSDERLKNLMRIILSVPSIGPVTALGIIITSNEFININTAKKYASYAGVAPFHYKSGSSVSKKTRVSKIANKRMKSLLHICAINARRNVLDIRLYYERKTNIEGKHKMLVINAIRFKLISRIFSCVNQNRLYDESQSYKAIN